MKRKSIYVYCSYEWEFFNRRDFFIEYALKYPSYQITIINRPFALIPNLFRVAKWTLKSATESSLPANIRVVRPVTVFHDLLPISSVLFISKYNSMSLKRLFSKDKSKLKELWVYDTIHFPIANIAKDEGFKIIWEIYDDYRYTHDGIERSRYMASDNTMLSYADIIFTLTSGIKEKYDSRHSRVFILGNGYSKSIFNENVKAYEYDSNARKVILYLGVIRDWIDFDTYQAVIQDMPNVDFLFVGPVELDVLNKVNDLKKNSNFIYFDRVDRPTAVAFMKRADLGLIIYKSNIFTDNVRPIKISEMLSVGTSVLSTSTADYSNITGVLVRLTDVSASSIVDEIKHMLLVSNSEMAISYSKKYSWDYIIDYVEECLTYE